MTDQESKKLKVNVLGWCDTYLSDMLESEVLNYLYKNYDSVVSDAKDMPLYVYYDRSNYRMYYAYEPMGKGYELLHTARMPFGQIDLCYADFSDWWDKTQGLELGSALQMSNLYFSSQVLARMCQVDDYRELRYKKLEDIDDVVKTFFGDRLQIHPGLVKSHRAIKQQIGIYEQHKRTAALLAAEKMRPDCVYDYEL